MILSFITCLALFVAIGLSSSLRSRGTKTDYYLASHSMPPWLVGLSAVATNNSGYMFIGVIGYTYKMGVACVFGPVILLRVMGAQPPQKHLLLVSGTGLATMLIWRQLGWHNWVYEGMPGILAGLAVYLPASILWKAEKQP